MTTAPTIKDVALAAGVSVATVSYVINDGPRPVTEDTRRRIEAAMRDLGYEPNVSARRLRRQHNQVLGLAIAGLSGLPGLSDLYFLDIMRGVGVAADRHDYDLMLFSSPRRLQRADFYPSLARKRMIDGLIVSGSLFDYGSVRDSDAARLPVVVVGRQSTSTHLRHVVFSYEEDAFQATRRLLEMGHRRIGLLSNALTLSGERERVQGYQRALQAAGLAVDVDLLNIPAETRRFPPRNVVAEMVRERHATALITAPYIEVCTFLSELGAAPDVAVATLDEEGHIPRPTSLRVAVRLAKYEAGQRAVELLLAVANDGQDSPEQVVVPSTYHVYSAVEGSTA